MPIDPANLAAFIVASALLTVAPGPDILFLVSQGMSRGRAAGLATALGLASGNLVHTTAAALGASLVFKESAFAFAILKYAGAAYLLYLAYKTVRARNTPPQADGVEAAGRRRLFVRGIAMNVLNPKVAIFFLAFLPGFASPERGPVWVQTILLGLVFVAVVIVVFGTVGLFAGAIGGWLLGRGGARFHRWSSWAVAGVLVLLAINLIVMSRGAG